MNTEAESTTAEPTTAASHEAEAPAVETAHTESHDEAHADSADDAHDDGDEGGEETEGGAEASGEASGEAKTEGGPAKKRRRRRRKKKPQAPGEAAVEGEGGEGGEQQRYPYPRYDFEGPPTAEEHAALEAVREKRKQQRLAAASAAPSREALPFRVGEEVFGKVERVTDDAIWVDVAGKALGLFDRRELGEGEPPTEGDQFIATVASHGVRGGMLRMSRAPFVIDEAKKKVEAALASGEALEGFVTGAIKGGVEVDIDGLRAFAPASHVELRPGNDLGHLVGRRLNFIVVQYEKKGRDVVVSRKKFLADEAHRARADALKALQPGTIHPGVVTSVVGWGVFVSLHDAGGIEGLIQPLEASHDRSARLVDLFKPGDHVEVKVLRVDDRGKLWLSRKAITNDPWDAVKEKYAVGSRHTGKVVRIQPFGAFIELEPGIDGLCYTADLSFKPIQHPNDLVKIDDPIDVVVATCDGPTRKISLHAAPPADEANEPKPKVGPHRILKVMVVSASEPGLVVRIIGLSGRAARGFIPAGHTGTQRGSDLRKFFTPGTKLAAKVLEVDPRRGETKLSIRALREDTEKAAYSEYRATVAREAKFGTFADLLKK